MFSLGFWVSARPGDPEGYFETACRSRSSNQPPRYLPTDSITSAVSALWSRRTFKRNAAISIDERTRRVESHVADAMRWLKGAAAAGFFREPDRVSWARQDADLAILSDRDEFRKLLASAAAKP